MKIKRYEIVKELKEEDLKDKKINVTYRLNKMLVDEFKEKCKQDNVGAGRVLEKMIAIYLEEK
ncbi:MAG: hypothetical protein ACPGJV_11635 [Bacteriovoracaceae bacterium]